ncbi:holin [Mycobacterium phage Ares]|uniref:Holin n=1 Tax=Mycobacterium phage Ares TaxID=1089112 RepID=G8I7H6_9CAUD|nr:holin [Mycobacterium phage Ares]
MAETIGPADPNAPTRAKVWAGLAVIAPLLSFLATFGILSSDQANAINGALTAVVGVLTAFGFGVAAKKTSEQVKNGTFDPAPPPPPPVLVPPAMSAVEGITAVANQFNDLVTGVTSGVKHVQDVVGGLAGAIPGLSGLPGLQGLDPNSLAAQAAQLAYERGGANQAAARPASGTETAT